MKQIEELYNTYFHDVYLYLISISHNEELAEEITQETFFKAMRSAGSFKGECDIRVWLCQIAKNTYLTMMKGKNRFSGEEIPESVSDLRVDIEEHLADNQQSMMIHKLLHDMAEPYKEIFSLRVFGELSFRQIGEIFGKTESWARVTYHRAKLRIIEKLEEVQK